MKLRLEDIFVAFEKNGYSTDNAEKYREACYYRDYPEKSKTISYEDWKKESEDRWNGVSSYFGNRSDYYHLEKHREIGSEEKDWFGLEVLDPKFYDTKEKFDPVYKVMYHHKESTYYHHSRSLVWYITTLDNFDEEIEAFKKRSRAFKTRFSLMDFNGNSLMWWNEKTKTQYYDRMDESGNAMNETNYGPMPDDLYDKYEKMLSDRKDRLEKEAEVTGETLVYSSDLGYHLRENGPKSGLNMAETIVNHMVRTKYILRKDEERNIN